MEKQEESTTKKGEKNKKESSSVYFFLTNFKSLEIHLYSGFQIKSVQNERNYQIFFYTYTNKELII